MVDVAAVKAALSDVAGIDGLTLTNIGGRMVFGWNGLIAAVDPSSDIAAVQAAIRKAVGTRAAGALNPAPTQIATDMLAPAAAASTTTGKPMTTTPAAPGSFAAGLKAIMDEARNGIVKARADGVAQVQEAVGKLNEAKVATTKVAGTIAQQIHDEAESVMSELGQISNDLG